MAQAKEIRIVKKTIGALALAAVVATGGDARALVLGDGPGADAPGTTAKGGGAPTFERRGGDGRLVEASRLPGPFVLRFPVVGPDRWLCARPNGAVFSRGRCRPSEETIDPTVMQLCRSSWGALRLTGTTCGTQESPVDMRRVRGVEPAAWRSTAPAIAKAAAAPGGFGQSGFERFGPEPSFDTKTAEPDAFEPDALAKKQEPGSDPSSSQKPDAASRDSEIVFEPKPIGPGTVFVLPDGLCERRDGKASLHALCPPGETPIAPDDLRSCVKKSGVLELRASKCPTGARSVDLREFRTPGTPVGIGPLVGILPRLTDLPAEYPGL